MTPKIEMMTISAVLQFKLNEVINRTIFVKGSPPLTIAYMDSNDCIYNIVELDKDDYVDSSVNLIENNGILYLGTIKGNIYRSVDKGVSWEVIQNVMLDDSVKFLIGGLIGVVFAASKTVLIKSEDGGLTWDFIEPPKSFEAINFSGEF